MKRLLVHLHLYYAAQCDYFVEKLQNISGCEWKLFVTMPVYYKKEAEILKNAHEQTEIIITENYGADIWPFIKLIHKTDLNEYDYILKLHTKSYNPNGSRVNGIWYKGYEWRNAMVESYLKDDSTFLHAIRMLEESPKNGMVCNPLFYKVISEGTPEDTILLQKELKRLNLHVSNRHYCIGSIFLARSNAYKLLQTPLINVNLFKDKFISHKHGSKAHVYERIISLVIYASGMKIVCLKGHPLKTLYIKLIIEKIQPFMEKIFSIKRYGAECRKIMTIFGIKIPLE